MLRVYTRLLAMLSLALVLSAANSGSEIERETDMSRFLQSFNLPFAGRTSPSKPRSTINCEFNDQHPAHAMFPGFVAVPSKFRTFDPDNIISIAAIDPARQMLLLNAVGDKVWAGVYEDLPVPAVGQTLEYMIYTYATLASVGGPSPYTDQLLGLLIANDLFAAPTTSDLWSVHSRYARILTAIEGNNESGAWAAYNSLNVPQATVENGWPTAYMRARVASSATAGPVYSTTLEFDVSSDGIGWQPVSRFSPIALPMRHALLGVRPSGGVDVGAYFGYIRHEDTGDRSLTSGGIQRFGAV